MITKLSKFFLGVVESDRLLESIEGLAKNYRFESEPMPSAFGDVAGFEYLNVPEQWEAAMIPYVWAEGADQTFAFRNMEKILLFKV